MSENEKNKTSEEAKTTTRKPRTPKKATINFPNLAEGRDIGQSNKDFNVKEQAEKVWIEIVRTANVFSSDDEFSLGVKGNEPIVVSLTPKNFYEQYIYPITRERAFSLNELKEAKDIFKMLMITSDELVEKLDRKGVFNNVRDYDSKVKLTKRMIPFCHFPSANGQQIKKNPSIPAGRVLNNVLHIPGLSEEEIKTFSEFLKQRNG